VGLDADAVCKADQLWSLLIVCWMLDVGKAGCCLRPFACFGVGRFVDAMSTAKTDTEAQEARC
jgi:hypothetical protein